MRTRFQLLICLIVVLSLFNTALAQDNRPASEPGAVILINQEEQKATNADLDPRALALFRAGDAFIGEGDKRLARSSQHRVP